MINNFIFGNKNESNSLFTFKYDYKIYEKFNQYKKNIIIFSIMVGSTVSVHRLKAFGFLINGVS